MPFVLFTQSNARALPRIGQLIARHGRAALDKLYARVQTDPVASKLLPTVRRRFARRAI